MPSFWKRIGLAAALTAQVSASPVLTFAQHHPSTGTHCTTMQPCPPAGRAHVITPGTTASPTPEPPPWQEPSTSPMPPSTSPMPPSTSPMPPSTTPMPPSTSPMPPSTSPMTPDTTPMPPDTTQTQPDFTPPSDQALSFNQQQLGIGSPDQAFAPNMMGDLLRGYRSVNFPYNGGGDFSAVLAAGAANLRNSKVSENNSAVPRTRFSFRYNYFHNANDVQGFALSPETINVTNFGDFAGNPNSVANIPRTFPASKSFDAHFYTLGWEQAFLDNLASLEVRVPIANTLDSDLTFIGSRELAGTGAPAGLSSFQGIPANVPLDAAPLVAPGSDVLGNTDTELQDITLILKGVLWQSRDRRMLVSGGTGVTIPTGEDVNVTVVDTYDDLQGFEPPFSVFNLSNLGSATNFRTRDIDIENEIWELSPYLAMVALPTERTFVNGFVQVNVPLNSADVDYRERRVDIVARDIFPTDTAVNFNGQPFGPGGLEGDFRQSGSIEDQMLLQVDIGTGYWLYRNPTANDITGVASLLELHYTTTLEDADIVTFQPEPTLFGSGTAFVEPPTQIGNLANRIDILNLTAGGVVQLANTATLAVGYVVPLRDDFDRTFDGEVNVQFNLYR